MTLLLTCVRIEADGCVESLASLEHIESELDLGAVPARVDLAQGVLQTHPEADLLQGCAARGISLQSSHLHQNGERRPLMLVTDMHVETCHRRWALYMYCIYMYIVHTQQ